MSVRQAVKIGDIATFAAGYSFSPDLQGRESGEVPFLKVSDMNLQGNEVWLRTANNWVSENDLKTLRARAWPEGTVVFPKVGAALLTEKRRLLARDSAFDNNVMGLVAGPGVEPFFLYLLMCKVRLSEIAQLGAVPSVNQSKVAEVQVALPELPVQRRIVDLVSSVDDLVVRLEQERSDAERSLAVARDELLSGSSVPLSSVLLSIESGKSVQTSGDSPVAGRARILKISAVRSGQFDAAEAKRLDTLDGFADKHVVKNGDLLMTRSNTPDRVGFVAMAVDVPAQTYMPDLIWRLRPDPEVCTPEFLEHALSSPAARARITATATGTSASMRKVNKRGVAGISLPVPSLPQQRDYARECDQFRAVARALTDEVARLTQVRRALVDELLTGERDISESYDALLGRAS